MAKLLNQPPKYCKDAIASTKGWSHPKTGELLVSNKSLDLVEIEKNFAGQVLHPPIILTIAERNQLAMDALFDEPEYESDVSVDVVVSTNVEPTEITEIEPVVEEIIEIEPVEPIVEQLAEEIVDYEEMTKAELLSYAKDAFDVALPKKDNKTTLIEKIKELNE